MAGHWAGAASWATNVGNEHGQVLMSVLTTGEGPALMPMAQGLVARYHEAAVEPPKVLYVDRDCCSNSSSIAVLKEAWPSLEVRMDTWHFMRRCARGVITDAHILYGPFMSGLSQAIFQWDQGDLRLLKLAKR